MSILIKGMDMPKDEEITIFVIWADGDVICKNNNEIYEAPDTRIRHLYCGECGKQMPIFEKFPYCPNCGARMVSEE